MDIPFQIFIVALPILMLVIGAAIVIAAAFN